MVCGDVLIIGVGRGSRFQEHASWMLQTVLGRAGKADAALNFCQEQDVTAACKELGFSSEEIGLVRLWDPEFSGIRVVGTGGKRSVMLAVVIALALRGVGKLNDLWTEVHEYDLEEPFSRIISIARDQLVRPNKSPEASGNKKSVMVEGVDLQIICGRVPMLDVNRTSIFYENVSWLLQTATGSSFKADSLYTFCDDKEILKVCHSMGLKDNEIGLARLKDDENVLAVGTCGKRSIMLALVVALGLANAIDGSLEGFKKEMTSFNARLVEPFTKLVDEAERMSDKIARVNCKRGTRKHVRSSSVVRQKSVESCDARPTSWRWVGVDRWSPRARQSSGPEPTSDSDLAELDRLLEEYIAETDDEE